MKKSFIKAMVSLGSVMMVMVSLYQCTGVNKSASTVENLQQSSDSNSYVNLYDGRAAFPDSVHKSWQQGNIDEVRESVLTYIDGMITGVQAEIEKYTSENNKEKLDNSTEKLERIQNLKEEILNATSKEDIKNAMHKEFKSGDYKDLYGTGK